MIYKAGMKIGKTSKVLVISLIITFTVSGLLIPQAASAQGKVFVLVYHSFLGNRRFPSDISLPELTSELNYLKDHGYRFVTLSDIISGRVTGPKNILVSIDDGNQSVYQAYQTTFKPLGVRPLLCIYPNIIGKKNYALTWEQLSALVQAGCEIATHGFYHFPLTQKAFAADPAAFRKEIFHSKETIEKRLKTTVIGFAYPNGVRSPIAEQLLKEAGYRCAFTVVWGAVQSPLSQNPEPFALPRFMIYKNNWEMVRGSIIKSE